MALADASAVEQVLIWTDEEQSMVRAHFTTAS
jgi:hypothetical protein